MWQESTRLTSTLPRVFIARYAWALLAILASSLVMAAALFLLSRLIERRHVAGLLILVGALGLAISYFLPLSNTPEIAGLEGLRRVDFRFPVASWLWPLVTLVAQCAPLVTTGALLLANRAPSLGLGLVLGISAWVLFPAIDALLVFGGGLETGVAFWTAVAAGWLGLGGGVFGAMSLRAASRPKARGPVSPSQETAVS